MDLGALSRSSREYDEAVIFNHQSVEQFCQEASSFVFKEAFCYQAF